MTFTINKYRSYGPKRDDKIARIQSKIDNLQSKDELTGKQSARLERLIDRLDRKTPKDELIVHYKEGNDTFGVTIIDSLYDNTIIGGQYINVVVDGVTKNENESKSRHESKLSLNHPLNTNEKYNFSDNQTVSVGGLVASEIFDMESTVVSIQSEGVILFSQSI